MPAGREETYAGAHRRQRGWLPRGGVKVCAMERLKLPIGIQTFREIREDGHYYVDKTPHILGLVEGGKHYFLSRPRRFGKSLLLDTVKELFEGNRELFAGLDAESRWPAGHGAAFRGRRVSLLVQGGRTGGGGVGDGAAQGEGLRREVPGERRPHPFSRRRVQQRDAQHRRVRGGNRVGTADSLRRRDHRRWRQLLRAYAAASQTTISQPRNTTTRPVNRTSGYCRARRSSAT